MKGASFFIILLVLLIGVVLPEIFAHDSSNLEVNIPKDRRQVAPGDTVWFTIKFFNLANTDRLDVILNYAVADSHHNLLIKKSETVAVETQASFARSFEIPENMVPGLYEIQVTFTYPDKEEAFAECSFEVIPKERDSSRPMLIIIGLLLLAILAFAIFKSKTVIQKMKLRMKVHRIVRQRRL